MDETRDEAEAVAGDTATVSPVEGEHGVGVVLRNAKGQVTQGSGAVPGGGAPIANWNAVTSGVRITPRRLVLGTLPTEYAWAERTGRAYRRIIEDAIVAERGQVTVADAHAVDTATSYLLHSLVCQHLLRRNIKSMSVTDVCRVSEAIAKARENRDRAYARLGLRERPRTPDEEYEHLWATLDQQPRTSHQVSQDATVEGGSTSTP